MSKVLGIDLGTTNSCAALMEAGGARVLPNREGSRTTSSIVGFTAEEERVVGQIAKRQAIVNPQNTVFAVKRLIGRKFEDPVIQESRQMLPYALVPAENGDIQIEVREKRYSPEEISSFIIREMRSFAEDNLGQKIEQAVVTVPAHFNDSQRQATRDAGTLADLEVLRILNEPTAAALAYGVDQRAGQRTVVVYDLGGGTFDVSILRLAGGVFEVLATAGESFLGGEDFDLRIMDWLVSEFLAETGVDLQSDRMALQRLKEASERAKCELSMEVETLINLPFIASDPSGPQHFSRRLTRDEFEILVEDLVRRTEGPCLEALEEAGLRPDQVDDVLLVGGQTRTPLVAQTVERLFGRPPDRGLNPDEVVAMGAAIQGGILSGEVRDIVLLDVTPLSLGVETSGGLFTKLIERNATIPTKATETFTTVSDNQTRVEVHVLQGERPLASQNKSLGRFDLVGIPPAPRGVPQIEVTFAIDSNGIVNVSARDIASQSTQSIQINPAGGLSQKEIDRLLEEARTEADLDRERGQVRRLRSQVQGQMYTIERVLKQFQESLPASERNLARESLSKARSQLQGGDRGDLEAALADLKLASQLLSEWMMEGAQGS